MHDDSLTPETAERLLDGEITSPEFADLVLMVGDVRNVTSSTPTPAVRGALAEYVGVGLTATELPVDVPADQPRRRSVFAEALAFAGTVSGKLLIGGAVAAASVTGAQTAGLVDLPGLPDNAQTVVVADEGPETLPLDDVAPLEEERLVEEAKPEMVEPDVAEKPEVSSFEEDKIEDKLIEQEKPVEEEKPAEEKPVEEEKVEEKPVEEPKTEEPKTEEPKDEPSEYDAAVTALQEQLYKDKDAVYAAASELIKPLEAEKKPLIEALNATLATLEQNRNEAKAPLYAELETTEDEARKAEIEAELNAIYWQWETDRDAAIADASPAINEIKQQLEAIELERDAEISRLLEKFQADIDALGK